MIPSEQAALYAEIESLTRDPDTPGPVGPVTRPYQSTERWLAAIRSATRQGRFDPSPSPVDLRPAHGWRLPAVPRMAVAIADPMPPPDPSPRPRKRTRESRAARRARLAMIADAEARGTRRRSGVNLAGAGPSYAA